MPKYMIDKHPLDVLDDYLAFLDELEFDSILDNDDERRYIAEHKAVRIDESSSLEECAYTVSKLTAVHIPQLNARFKDIHDGQHYSNPIELIREETKKRDNKKIWFTGNVAKAHERIKSLNEEIVSEETPAQMLKTVFWCLLFGLPILALAIYSSLTGAAVNAATWMINSTWFKVIFILATLGLSLYFGFFSMGVLIVGGIFLIAWIILELPGLAAVIVNGVLFVIAGILLLVALSYLGSAVKYKPLSEEEHRLNQERITEKEALRRELEEYSDTMIAKLDIMKKKFSDNDREFLKEMKKHLSGNYDTGAIYEIFSFLNRYYRKMKK